MKIIEIAATECHILKLKCTKFDYGIEVAYSAPPDLAGFKGPILLREERMGRKGKGGERGKQSRGREGKGGEGMKGERRKGGGEERGRGGEGLRHGCRGIDDPSCLSTSMSVCLSVCLSVYLSVCLFLSYFCSYGLHA